MSIWKIAILLLMVAVLVGCSSSKSGGNAEECEPDQVMDCECPDGQSGSASCDDEGQFGDCHCPGNQSPSDDVGPDEPDAGPGEDADTQLAPDDAGPDEPDTGAGDDVEDSGVQDDTGPSSNDNQGPGDGCGIAAQHPGDEGIDSHPAVIFTEDFEHQSKEIFEERYTDVRRPENMEFVDDVADVSPGQRSLRMESIGGEDTGSDLYRNFATTDEETYDELYVRYYVQYVHDHSYHHAGVRLGGYNPPTNWPQGGAGTRPDGDDRFKARAQPMGSDLHFDLYTYWMGMGGNPGDDSYWGNTFLGDVHYQVPDQEWMAVEFRIAVNDPVDSSNGEMTLWIDGEEIVDLREGSPEGEWLWDTFYPGGGDEPFQGFQWRNDPDLDLSFVWLHHYVTQHEDGEASRMWFNDVVVATEYIGPINGLPCP